MTAAPALLIDFDGTICFDHFWRSANTTLFQRIKNFLFAEESQIVHAWMKGEYKAEQVNAIVAEELDCEYEVLWRTFVHDCKTMSIDHEVLQQIASCKKRYQTILVTDNMDCFDRFTVPALNLERYFHRLVNSYNYGVLKDDDADKGLFQRAARLNNFSIENSILIDNSKENCHIFECLGGKSHLVSSKEDINKILVSIMQ